MSFKQMLRVQDLDVNFNDIWQHVDSDSDAESDTLTCVQDCEDLAAMFQDPVGAPYLFLSVFVHVVSVAYRRQRLCL